MKNEFGGDTCSSYDIPTDSSRTKEHTEECSSLRFVRLLVRISVLIFAIIERSAEEASLARTKLMQWVPISFLTCARMTSGP
jgi:hypothetical protein